MAEPLPTPDDVAPWPAVTRFLLPLAVGVGAVALGLLRGPGAGILAFAAAALLLAITVFWQSLRVLAGETPLSLDAAVHLAEASSEEEQKRAILRALKDLEQERALGKLTDEDFEMLSAQYRTEAKRILRALDATLAPARKRAEELIEERKLARDAGATEPAAKGEKKGKRRKKDGAEGKKEEEPVVVQASSAEPGSGSGSGSEEKQQAEGEKKECAGCSTSNDGDAEFCKKCGKRLAEENA
jgi:hypothetical protein